MRLKDIVIKMSDEELKKAVIEIEEWHNTTVLTKGVTRKIADQIHEEIKNHYSLELAEKMILREAALRYCKFVK